MQKTSSYSVRADLPEYDRMTELIFWTQLLIGTYKGVEEKKINQ